MIDPGGSYPDVAAPSSAGCRGLLVAGVGQPVGVGSGFDDGAPEGGLGASGAHAVGDDDDFGEFVHRDDRGQPEDTGEGERNEHRNQCQ